MKDLGREPELTAKDRRTLWAKLERAEDRIRVLEAAFGHLKVTSIGPDRSAPEGTLIRFMFEDEYKALIEGVA